MNKLKIGDVYSNGSNSVSINLLLTESIPFDILELWIMWDDNSINTREVSIKTFDMNMIGIFNEKIAIDNESQ